MHREQRVDALEIRAGGEENGCPSAIRGRSTGGRRGSKEDCDSRREHGVFYIQAMLRALTRRAIAGLAVIVGVVTLMFFLLRIAPGDPALLLVGPTATQEQLSAQRRALGLDRPIIEQYAAWVRQFVRGDWGTSIATGRSVRAMIGDAWPATVRLVGLSLVLSYLLGIAVGAVQAARGGRLDTTLSVVTVTLFALPGYWLGLMLVMVFTYWLRVLPAFGAAGFDADFLTGWDRLLDRLRHLALPLATLTLIGIGGTARYVRGAMLDVKGAPYVTIAYAKGLSPVQVTIRHVLRNALIPVLTLLGLSLPALFSGAVFIEAIFAWPGVGRIMVEAVGARDYPVIMAATAVSAILVVFGNLLAEGLAAWADPRLRTTQVSGAA
jgi:peptide/nickel transport system permease protein